MKAILFRVYLRPTALVSFARWAGETCFLLGITDELPIKSHYLLVVFNGNVLVDAMKSLHVIWANPHHTTHVNAPAISLLSAAWT
jgi:hypothetical protein